MTSPEEDQHGYLNETIFETRKEFEARFGNYLDTEGTNVEVGIGLPGAESFTQNAANKGSSEFAA